MSLSLSTPAIIGRLFLAGLLAAIGEFCMFGFFASFEPGSSLWYRIVYLGLATLVFCGAIFLALSPLATRRSVRKLALIGICVGGGGALVLAYLVVLSGPRGDSPWTFGVSYAFLAAPLGAIIGGTLGALLGLRGQGTHTGGESPNDRNA
jgi:hypothetical protein